MSKDYKNIDDLFQKELGGTVRKAPAQAKVNIDKALGERNKKYRYFWLLFPIGIGILFLLNAVYSYHLLNDTRCLVTRIKYYTATYRINLRIAGSCCILQTLKCQLLKCSYQSKKCLHRKVQ